MEGRRQLFKGACLQVILRQQPTSEHEQRASDNRECITNALFNNSMKLIPIQKYCANLLQQSGQLFSGQRHFVYRQMTSRKWRLD